MEELGVLVVRALYNSSVRANACQPQCVSNHHVLSVSLCLVGVTRTVDVDLNSDTATCYFGKSGSSTVTHADTGCMPKPAGKDENVLNGDRFFIEKTQL